MPPKPKKTTTPADDITSVVSQCLNDFLQNFTCDCDCVDKFSALFEEMASCKSLIMAQTTLITQLQSDITALKLEMLNSRPNPQVTLTAVKNKSDNRRTSTGYKNNTDTNVSLNVNDKKRTPDDCNTDTRLPERNSRRYTGNFIPLSKYHNQENTRSISSSDEDHDFEDNEGQVAASKYPNPIIPSSSGSREVLNIPRSKLASNNPQKRRNLTPNTNTGRTNSKRSNIMRISKNNATFTGAKAKLLPMKKLCYTYVSNFDPEQTVDDILEVLREIDEEAEFKVEKPEHLNKKPTSSVFTIAAPIKFESMIQNPDFWPEHIYVNKYYLPRNTKKFPTAPVNQTNT